MRELHRPRHRPSDVREHEGAAAVAESAVRIDQEAETGDVYGGDLAQVQHKALEPWGFQEARRCFLQDRARGDVQLALEAYHAGVTREAGR
jgi:hypothetical protein